MADPTNDESPMTATNIALTFARGILMGGADVIPGVSGGTVALVVGIYQRLITAISNVDIKFLGYLRRFKIRAAIGHIDAYFLAPLGVGIATGVVALGMFMNDLLADPTTRSWALGAFFGMIVASSILVFRMVSVPTTADAIQCVILAVLGAVVACALTSSTPSVVEEPSYLYLVVCGMISICAMILPGISGAYLLVILGVYAHLTRILKGLSHFELGTHEVLVVGSVAGGCAIGLTCFSRLLKWLLQHHNNLTMATLCGFMIGALPKIWPFQIQEGEQFRNVFPEVMDGQVVAVMAIGILALAGVLMVHFLASRIESKPEPH